MRFFATALLGVCFLAPQISWSKPEKKAVKKKCEAALEQEASAEVRIEDVFAWVKGAIEDQKTLPSYEHIAREFSLSTQELGKLLPGLNSSNLDKFWSFFIAQETAYVEKLRKKIARILSENLKENLKILSDDEIAEKMQFSSELVALLLHSDDQSVLEFISLYYPTTAEVTQNKLLRFYAKASKEYYRTLELEEFAALLELNPTEIQVLVGESGLFKSVADLQSQAQKKSPQSFKFVVNRNIYTPEREQRLLEAIKNRSRLVVTTAVSGAPVDKEFFQTLLKYCKENDAEILVYAANMETNELDPLLLETEGVHIITHNAHINDWFELNKIKIIAKQIRPLTGLDRLSDRGQSILVASPKQHVKVLPSGYNEYHPVKQMTTGAITLPNYAGKKWISGRTDEIAKRDHVMGAMVLERNNPSNGLLSMGQVGNFHTRHIEYIPEEKGFLDLDYFYTATKKTRKRVEALDLGDIHIGDTDQHILSHLEALIKKFRPKYVVLHDLLNGYSISPHEVGQLISIAQKAKKGMLDLSEELQKVVSFINALMAIDSQIEIVVVPSNHDYWLHRWLQSGQFMKEPHNTALGLELAQVFAEKKDPFKHALMNGGLEYPKRLIFIERGNGMKVGKRGRWVEIGQHGDKGANGARASLLSMLRAFGRAVFGHTHTYGRMNGAVNIGTFTGLRLGYMKEGVSSWVQSLATVGPHGEIQVLEFQNNEFFNEKAQENATTEDFFPEGFPYLEPNNESSDTGQVDQYS